MLLPLAFLLALASGCARMGYQPVRDCGIRCLHQLAEHEEWESDRLDQLDTLRHSRERERGYTALELVAIMRSLDMKAETDRVSEEQMWAMALMGARPLLLIQNDLHARAFPNDYHWVLVEGTDTERERYRVYLADRRGASAWWGRERLARYHARGEGIVIIPGREEP